MKLFRLLQSKLKSLRPALLFAGIATGVLAVGVSLIWRVLERDNAAFVQQSIGDAASILAAQVRLEVDSLGRTLLELGGEKIKAQVNRQESELKALSENRASPVNGALAETAAVVSAANTVGTIDCEPEISEISFWRRPDPRQPAERAYVAINSRFTFAYPDRMARIQELENSNRTRIDPAFHGHSVVLADPFSGLAKPMALVAFPLGHGEVNEVISAHVSLEKIQKLFSVDALVQSELVDRDGVVLAHPDAQRIGHSENEPGRPLQPIFEHLGDTAGIESGLQALTGSDGKLFYGGFRKISNAGLTVLSSIPADQAGTSLEGLRNQIVLYLALVFIALFGGRTLQLARRKPGVQAGSAVSAAAVQTAPGSSVTASGMSATPAPETSEPAEPSGPRKVAIVALHGSLRGFNQLLDTGGPEEAAEALNDYLAAAAAAVRGSGGHFECYTGASFGASWELGAGADASATHKAVACGLVLRSELERLNESRKLDGKKPLKQGMGIHVGQALAARLGVASELKPSVTGEALACARALDRLALAEGKDFVMSQDVLKSARGVFTGKSLGEARLTPDTGLTPYYSVVAFREDAAVAEGALEPGTLGGQERAPARDGGRMTGGETRIHILHPEAAPQRWLVNNGTQIVGPFTAEEISQRLFTQELDFECECWHEETGRSSRLDAAGIFTGSEDSGAGYWVYDGGLVHGPVSEGFVRTAFQHGAVTDGAFVCQKSTISGWRKIGELIAELDAATARKQEKGSGQEAA